MWGGRRTSRSQHPTRKAGSGAASCPWGVGEVGEMDECRVAAGALLWPQGTAAAVVEASGLI